MWENGRDVTIDKIINNENGCKNNNINNNRKYCIMNKDDKEKI